MPNVQIDVVTDAIEQAVTLAEAKAWLRVTHSEDDAVIAELIGSATNSIETFLNNPIITKTFLYKNDGYLVDQDSKCFLVMPYYPSAIDWVKVYDKTDTATTLTTTKTYGEKILLGEHGISARDNHAYQVQFQSGIAANAANTPQDIKIVMKEIISYAYDGACNESDMNKLLANLSCHMNFNQLALE